MAGHAGSSLLNCERSGAVRAGHDDAVPASEVDV
jgi:hypothetical protein